MTAKIIKFKGKPPIPKCKSYFDGPPPKVRLRHIAARLEAKDAAVRARICVDPR
jgi:hypothetical protein